MLVRPYSSLLIARAARKLLELISIRRPTALVTHAFEGGHPDHDCCNFLACRIGRYLKIPVWEFPEYSAPPNPLIQHFGNSNAPEIVAIAPTVSEFRAKCEMFRQHRSQEAVLNMFNPRKRELFRKQPKRNYFRPEWSHYFSQSRYTSAELVEAFRSFDHRFSLIVR